MYLDIGEYMKILLRKLIHEYIDEMAYGGMIKSVNLKPFFKGTKTYFGDERKPEKPNEFHSAIEKFHHSNLFLKKANAAFKHFPFDVWVMSVSVPDYEKIFDMNFEKRYRVFNVEETIERLKKYNVDVPEEQLRSITGSGGCVIMSSVGSVNKSFLPTPWMIIHAIFDSTRDVKDINSVKGISSIRWDLNHFLYKINLDEDVLCDYMTTKSALNQNFLLENDDVLTELLTQEVITTSGVVFKESDDPEITRKLELIKHKIKSYNLKEKISNMFRGRVVLVETAVFA